MIAYVLALVIAQTAGQAALKGFPAHPFAFQQSSPQSEPKPKKQKKVKPDGDAKPGPDAPDDVAIADQVVDTVPRSGLRTEWKNHPSIRFGSVLRVDFTIRLQEDARQAYAGAPQLNCTGTALPTPCLFELHRNRIGSKAPSSTTSNTRSSASSPNRS